MSTIENNKIIAEFMELEENNFTGAFKNADNKFLFPSELNYHSDWNLLMEVVEKCLIGEAEHKKEGNKLVSLIYEGLTELSKTKTYNACLAFIEWHNSQKLQDKENPIESAKQTLQENGYYSGNMWTVHDVQHKFKCSDKEALEVLEGVFTNGATIEEINNTISLYARENGLPEFKPDFFYISGFYKDDKTKFSDYLVYAFDSAPNNLNDDDIFFYGLSEDDIKECIASGWETAHDFVITSYEKVII